MSSDSGEKDAAFEHWKKRLNVQADAAKNDSDEELDDNFSGSEVKFSEPDDKEDCEYSMDNDDFALSSSFKKAPRQEPGTSASKVGQEPSRPSAAQQRLNKILEQEKEEARQKKLAEIMAKQKAEMKAKLGIDSEEDSDDSQEEKAPSKAAAGKPSGSKKEAMKYFMEKMGKDAETSEEISDDPDALVESEHEVPVVSEQPVDFKVESASSAQFGAGLVAKAQPNLN